MVPRQAASSSSSSGAHPGWAEHAVQLAHWTLECLANRTDVWVRYLSEDRRSYNRIATTAPSRNERGCRILTPDVLARHYVGANVSDLIGLHSTSENDLSKWLSIDIGGHDSTAVATASTNFRAAVAWYDVLRSHGYRTILEDSNGKGDYHLVALLDRPAQADHVHSFGRSLVSNYAELGLPRPPQILPGRTKLETGGFGDWLRLPGRHHSHSHWSRIWDGENWQEGAAAAELLLSTMPSESMAVGAASAQPASLDPAKGAQPLPEVRQVFHRSGKPDAASAPQPAETDAQLRLVMDAWPGLSAAVKAAILAMVSVSQQGDKGEPA